MNYNIYVKEEKIILILLREHGKINSSDFKFMRSGVGSAKHALLELREKKMVTIETTEGEPVSLTEKGVEALKEFDEKTIKDIRNRPDYRGIAVHLKPLTTSYHPPAPGPGMESDTPGPKDLDEAIDYVGGYLATISREHVMRYAGKLAGDWNKKHPWEKRIQVG